MSGSRQVDDEPYAVEWTATALRGLERLPGKAATAVVEFVYGTLAGNPWRLGHALHFELEGSLSARRGPYRVIYRIGDDRRTVTIKVIAHRRHVYRASGL